MSDVPLNVHETEPIHPGGSVLVTGETEMAAYRRQLRRGVELRTAIS